MKRLIVVLILSIGFAPSASAISLFNKHWKEHYLDGNPNAGFVRAARSAGCYICHVKGKEKKKVRNEYGNALSKYLDAADFPKDWVKENPEEAKKMIIEAFKKVEQDISADDRKFGEKIKAGELPATDAGLE